jgi:hypothetical protein
VFRWEREHFFDRSWVCVGRSSGPEYAGDQRVVEWQGWLFSREAVEQEGFDPSYASDFWDITDRQDWHACEAVQRGVYQLITMVANGYFEGKVSRPASRALCRGDSRTAPTPSTSRGSPGPV